MANIGGFVGPYVMGAVIKVTGSFRGGLIFAGVAWFISAVLLLALPKRTDPHAACWVQDDDNSLALTDSLGPQNKSGGVA